MKKVNGFAMKDSSYVYSVSTDLDLVYDDYVDLLTRCLECSIDDETIEKGRRAAKEYLIDNHITYFWSFSSQNGWNFKGIENVEQDDAKIERVQVLER